MVTMNIVITGGSGFVGSYLCEKLINDGNKIIVIDNLLTGSTENINNLMAEDALTIPASKDTSRPEISTYIFSFKNKYRRLHMRFSMRKDNIGTSAKASPAIIKLKEIIENDCAKYSLTYKLQKNEGIITNNILHGRKAFKDDKVKRKLLRIRSYERL